MRPEAAGWHSLTVPAGRHPLPVRHARRPACRRPGLAHAGQGRPRPLRGGRSHRLTNGTPTTGAAVPGTKHVLYELHPGLMGGFRGIQDQLPELQRLGVTAIELMPIADFPGRHNWGYDGVLPYAPDRAYGTPDELKSLVDAAHGLGMMVILDVVYNHFGPDGAYIHVFAQAVLPRRHPYALGRRDRLPPPGGARLSSSRTRSIWLKEYRFDGLRFDAVARHHGGGFPVRPRPHRSAARSSPGATSPWSSRTRHNRVALLGRSRRGSTRNGPTISIIACTCC